MPFHLERLKPDALRRSGENLEASARRARYRRLEDVRRRIGARYIVTAHQADDQAETVLIRWLQGSGVAGLAGMRPLQDRLARPLLSVGRAQLERVLSEAALEPVQDPDNRNLRRKRNLVRHHLLPRLEEELPNIADRLRRIAAAAAHCRTEIDSALVRELAVREAPGGAELSLSRLRRLPLALWPHGLALLQRLAGAPYPAGEAARRELARQIEAGGEVGCDCGGGWRWTSREVDRLYAGRAPGGGHFAYTVKVPGEVEIPESGLKLCLRPSIDGPPATGGSPERIAFRLPPEAGQKVVVRNRRPGDRIQPLGCSYSRRLKDVLIDHQVSREARERLPLLCVGEQIVWVPGVAADERFGGSDLQRNWIAELKRL